MITYQMPVKFHFGENVIAKHFSEIAQFGNKAMIVTGKSSAKKSGVLDDLIPALDRIEMEYIIFDEVTENPELKTVLMAKEIFLKNECDLVIGIGGGSPIDAAKAISICSANNFESNEFYYGNQIKKAFPIIAIPTTSGTGTEVTQYSVITDSENEKKAGFGHPLNFPVLSFLDPRYTISLSEKVTRDTAIDALSHLLEGLYSNRRNIVVYPQIFEGIRLIIEHLPLCLKNPKELIHREKLMLASLYGGIVIAQTSTTLQHSIGYPVTTKFGISHGQANGMFMKEIMELYYPKLENILDLLFDYLKMTKEEFYQWISDTGIETKIDISDEFIEEKTLEVMSSRNMALNPFLIDEETVKRLFLSVKK